MRSIPVASWAFALVATLALPLPANALIIDSFGTDQSLVNFRQTGKEAGTVSGGDILGGERELLSAITKNPKGSAMQALVDWDGDGLFRHEQGDGVIGYSRAIWDGQSATDLVGANDNGLGGLDFTSGGHLTGLAVTMTALDQDATVEFSFTTADGRKATNRVNLEGGQRFSDPLVFRYRDFVGDLGVITQADAFIMTISGPANTDLNMDKIASIVPPQEVPVPGTLLLLGAGLAIIIVTAHRPSATRNIPIAGAGAAFQ